MVAEARISAEQAGVELLDGGPKTRGRERLCVATREVRPIGDMIRFVVGPDGTAIPDLKCKLPGRGVWVTASRDALEKALKHKAFARGFKRDVRTPADLPAATDRLLEQAVLDALAIAGKAGLTALGFTRIAQALEHGDVIALLHAAEASPDGVRKLNAVQRRNHAGNPPAVIENLGAAQLDLALGRPNVIHAALLAGPASDTFLSRWRRLERFRTGGASDRGQSGRQD
jgi:predicted RNA-binding protein YlxR (DUF448 family)